MPTYEYVCKSCGYRFEKFQNMNDEPVKKCSKCGKTVKRMIGTGMGVIFKGSGFYATDYKNRSQNNSHDRGQRNACSNSKRSCEN